jgi:hypothetical protein
MLFIVKALLILAKHRNKTQAQPVSTFEGTRRTPTQIRKECTLKHPSFFGWYHILRGRYHLSIFEAMRSALWLAR